MPTITNFGDVVTVGNAAVNGTGTSSFAGPVTFAQGVSITGSVSTSSAFYGVLAGANTAAVSALTASTNVYAPIVTTPVSNAATAIATTGFYGALVGLNTASVTVLTASTNVNAPTINVSSLNVSSQANVTILNVSSFASFTFANVLTANITSANVTTDNVTTLNVSGFATLSRANIVTANVTSGNVLTANISTLNVSGFTTLFQANVLTANITSANVTTDNVTTLNVSGFATLFQANIVTANVTSGNVLTANISSLNVSGTAFLSNANVLTANLTSANVLTGNISVLNVSGTAFLSNANVLTANLTSANVLTGNISSLNVSGTAFLSNANVLTANISTGNIVSLNVTGDANIANLRIASNLITNNIIMSSNLSTNTGFGNVYLTGNLVVAGNIYSVGGSVGSGSGTSQGVLYSLGAGGYTLGSSFATGTAGPGIAGYHINMASFNPEAVASVSAFSAASGMLKFATGGLYQVTCVIVGDQPVAKIAIGKTSSASFPPSVTATAGYDYVYNYPVGSSPSEIITIPLTVQDVTQYYYLDVFFSTAAGTPSTLYPTRSTSAVGSNYGTYVQVGPFGNYLTSATGVASGLLMNAYGTTTLSSPVTSNTFRLAMTSSNGWTVAGVSTSLAVTSGGNFQVSQVGIYEVSMCLNAVGATPLLFGVGSLATDGAPVAQGPYIYQYAPMYTQDPTTVVTMPLNITDTSKYYYLDVIFPGTQATVALSNVSTFVSLKPVGSYVSPSTNPWNQQGTTVYYSNGAVAIGAGPSGLTETLTVSGNTAFVGNVTVTSDASSNNYVLARRVPAGSLAVSNYVTGSVPLTTTTSLINNYLSNAATITANTSTGTITQALSLPGTTTSGLIIPNGGSSVSLASGSANLYFECWINPGATTGGNRSVFARANATPAWDISFILSSTGAPSLTVWNTSGTLSSPNASNATTLSSGTWYHLAFSYVASTGVTRVFTNGGLGGTTGSLTGTLRATALSNIYIGYDASGSVLAANIADVRVWSGGIVPTATFASPAAAPFGTSQPAYLTGTPTLLMSLNSQYFPGASTSPYGPCLTLPGTVGSYYSTPYGFSTNWFTNGFCLEAWVNFASFANSNLNNGGAFSSFMLGHMVPTSGYDEWSFGPLTTGQVGWYWYDTTWRSLQTSSTITTGSWNHLMVQSNGSNVYVAVNGVFQTLTGGNFAPAGGSGSIAPSGPASTPTATVNAPITVGQGNTQAGPNFAIAKARLVFGNDTSAGSKAAANVYSTGNFTANPNFAAVPAGATVAWQLDSQYPLPTYPSIQDVTVVPSQLTSYGSIPTPVGGVTSNTLSPYIGTSLQSVRFDGTGYIDYGNAASSALTTNLWANAWTIEAWVYPTAATGNVFSRSTDLSIGLSGGTVNFYSGSQFIIGPAISLNQWTHIAATYDGTRANVYAGGTGTSTVRYVVVSSSTTGAYSYDGINWVPTGALPSASTWLSMAVNPITGRFAAAAYNSTAAAYSNDGITWVASTMPSSQLWRAITVNTATGRFVSVAFNTTSAAYSNDGITWVATNPLPSAVLWISVACNPTIGRFVAIAQTTTTAAYSSDGITWVATNPMPSSTNWISVACNPTTGRFAAVAQSTTQAAYSNDGITWVAATMPSNPNWYSVTVNPTTGRFVAIAYQSTTAAYSNDGITWVATNPLPSAANWNSVTVNPTNGRFVVTSDSTATAYSNDGITWVAATLPSSSGWNAVTVGTTIATPGPFTPTANVQVGGPTLLNGNLADVRVSNVARYTGSTYTVPSAPFATDSNTLLLLKSLGGQVGQTLQVQGRGLNSTSLGAGRTVQSYPPAPMSSYLLDTTSNASVTYGQGKYVASASTDGYSACWQAFDKSQGSGASGYWQCGPPNTLYSSSSPYAYTGTVTTVDTLGNAYIGEWIQIQMPVSVLLSSYSIAPQINAPTLAPTLWVVLGSRDGINWTLVNSQSYSGWVAGVYTTFNASASQAYNYYRMAVQRTGSGGGTTNVAEWTLNGTEESLCITNDSKVGVGIANPQRSLEVAGDLVVGGTISGGAGMGSFRNRIINGDMRIAQRGTGPTAITFGSGVYQIDRFCVLSAGVTLGGLTQSQQTLVASDTPYQLGFTNSWKMTVTSPLVYSYMQPNHNIEGYNIRDLNWGTSFGSPVTISFWFRANHPTGSLLGVTLRNLNSNYSYISPFTVTNSGYWQFVSFTVPPPPNGSPWYTDTNTGVTITFGGYQTQSPVMNSWQAANYVGPAGGYNWFAYAGNYIEFTGVQLEKGTVATPWEQRPYATELALCQRYYQKSYDDGVVPGAVTGTGALQAYFTSTGGGSFSCNFPVKMRADPVVVAYSSSSGTAGKMYSPGPAADFAVSVDKQSQQVLTIYANATLTVPNYYYVQWTANAEL